MKLSKKQIMGSIVVFAAASGVFYLTASGAAASDKKSSETISLPPQTEIVEKGDISEYVSASGTVSASDVNGIYIATTQKVSQVAVKLGDEVQVGDILVEYDIDYSRKELENNLASQRISLQSANVSLNSLTASKSESEILQLENSVNSAEKNLMDAENSLDNKYKEIETLKKNLDDAKKEVDDNKRLLEAGAITQEVYDQSVKSVSDLERDISTANDTIASLEKSISNAESSLKQAQVNLEAAGDPLGDESAKTNYQKQLYEIEKSRLAIQNVENQLSDLVEQSLAHVEGTVIELNVEEGSIVNDTTVILKIADLDNLIVNANVSEYDAPLLKIGQTVTITTDAIENTVYDGEITYISPVANVTSTFSGNETTVAIEVAIKNPDGILKPGYSVDMEILVTDVSGANVISLSAVQKDNQLNSYYVYTVDENEMIHKTYVEMGAFDDMTTQILSGLTEGDRIVTSPVSGMEDNTSLSDYLSEVQLPAAPDSGGMNGGQPGGSMMMPAGGMGGGGNGGGPGGRP